MQEKKVAFATTLLVMLLGAFLLWFWQEQQETPASIDSETLKVDDQSAVFLPRRDRGQTEDTSAQEIAPVHLGDEDHNPESCTVIVSINTDLKEPYLRELNVTFLKKKPLRESGRVQFASRDDLGRHVITDLSPGTWEISTYHPRAKPVEMIIELTAGCKKELDIEVQRKLVVDVYVRAPSRDQLDRLTKAWAELGMSPFVYTAQSPLTEQEQATVRYQGRKSKIAQWDTEVEVFLPMMKTESIGVIHAKVEPPLFAYLMVGSHSLGMLEIHQETEQLTFDVSWDQWQRAAGMVKVEVVDRQTKGPIEGLFAVIRSTKSRAALMADKIGKTTWRSQMLPPGRYHVSLNVGSQPQYQTEVTIGSGETTDLGLIEIQKPVHIKGRVVSEDGQGIKCAFAYRLRDATSPSAQGDPSETSRMFDHDLRSPFGFGALVKKATRTVSRKDGGFQIKNLPPGTYDFQIRRSGFSELFHEVFVPEKGVNDIVLKLERGIRVDFSISPGKGHVRKYVIQDTQGETVYASRAFGSWIPDVSLPRGTFTIFATLDTGLQIEERFHVEEIQTKVTLSR